MDIRYLGASKRYSEAVVANGLVFLSGMVPENPEADAKAQTENILAQIDYILGTIAGDDTIFVAIREGVTRGQILRVLSYVIPEIG